MTVNSSVRVPAAAAWEPATESRLPARPRAGPQPSDSDTGLPGSGSENLTAAGPGVVLPPPGMGFVLGTSGPGRPP